jgi:myosin-1
MLRKDLDFKIRHFAGEVIYASEGFVEKNKDTLFQDVKRLMFNSTVPTYKTVLAAHMILTMKLWQDGEADILTVSKRPVTAVRTFRVCQHCSLAGNRCSCR